MYGDHHTYRYTQPYSTPRRAFWPTCRAHETRGTAPQRNTPPTLQSSTKSDWNEMGKPEKNTAHKCRRRRGGQILKSDLTDLFFGEARLQSPFPLLRGGIFFLAGIRSFVWMMARRGKGVLERRGSRRHEFTRTRNMLALYIYTCESGSRRI